MNRAMLCSDCALWAANRDDLGADQDWRERVAVGGVLARIGAFVPQTGDEGEGIHPFSTVPCDGCGTHLAGYRIEADWPDAAVLGMAYAAELLRGVLS